MPNVLCISHITIEVIIAMLWLFNNNRLGHHSVTGEGEMVAVHRSIINAYNKPAKIRSKAHRVAYVYTGNITRSNIKQKLEYDNESNKYSEMEKN